MSGGDSNLRLFVGLYPPIEAAQRVLGLLNSVELAPHRLTPSEQVHLTVQFIGDRRAAEVDSIRESIQRSASGIKRFELRPLRLITLPERGRPRLVAIETDAPAGLLELQCRLAKRLARRTRERPDDRFRPHFTLCRYQRDARADRIDEPINTSSFAIGGVRLMRSVLRPEGAQHVDIDQIPLA